VVINLERKQQRVVDLAIQSGAFHNSNEVIATAAVDAGRGNRKMGQARKREAMSALHASRGGS